MNDISRKIKKRRKSHWSAEVEKRTDSINLSNGSESSRILKKIAYASNDTANGTAIANADQVKAIC